ncbi:acyl-CoA desaturase [Cellulomonas sp. zg-ZUI188]|uniref:Acyl-CoA desaturase n=2 Tax=Cellulomonas fengjieae TaxID=2819978 RepID=A0ABS3SEJ6_9CELL|nr:acyl-CoA desaturase [Cellulomonas fengjieae]MBO3101339.1 acyl-CoA desaturase [Cellulomonas fengjieae]QVI67930.1 acyl-CoA desaturase [Cellulomonas fengjieae]
MVATAAAFAGIWVAVVLVGDSWWQLAVAAAFAVVLTQVAFLGHDSAHRQIFTSGAWNDWAARIWACGFAGLSASWWRSKHNRHHASPNQQGSDPDIAPGVVVWTADVLDTRTGFSGWFGRNQGWFFFPLLTLEGLSLHVSSLRLLLSKEPVQHRWVELPMVVTRLVAYPVALFLLLPPGKAVAFIAVQMALFGVLLGGSFAPNHKGMPIIPAGMKVDFLRRQVLTSRNIRGGIAVDFMMGGLNYQVEHHLFPSMPRPNLKLVQPVVRDYCEKLDVKYTEVGFFRSYKIIVSYLNRVGLADRGAFDCPVAAQYGR